jgi:ATP-binding cassette subfamily F protein 3
MLIVDNLHYRAAGRPLLEGASFTLADGEKVGLVGANGSGKTTLIKLIAGEWSPEGGEIRRPKGRRLGQLAQEAPDGEERLIDWVLAADRERALLIGEAEECREAARLAEIHERLIAIAADSAPARAARILAGLGFDAAQQARPLAEFSGGWRMRVALAALLFSAPDLLLLDEPSNHLDLEARLWLEGYLQRYPGTVLLVSHDRELLNRVPTRILHLEAQQLTAYRGNYEAFLATRAARRQHQQALRKRQLAERQHMQAFVDRFRAKATKARQAQSRLKALERLATVASVATERQVRFAFPAPRDLAPPLITLEGATAGYAPGRPLLRQLALRLDPDDRIALLGANGNGKTTLLRLLAGRLEPLGGSLRRAPRLSVGYYAQEQAETLDLAATPLQMLARLRPRANEQELRAQFARFGLGVDQAELKVASLSGGEKARLAFALVTAEAPQLLLLDEPTNHLDIESREALIAALNDFPGAVVLVSHDPHVIELTVERFWLVAEGRVTPFQGDLSDYRRRLEEAEPGGGAAGNGNGAAPSAARNRRRARAAWRAATAELRRTAAEAEARVARLTADKAALEARLADPAVYGAPSEGLQAVQQDHARLARDLAEAESAWLGAAEALEAAADEMPEEAS